MRKLYSAIALCTGLLIFEAAVFMPTVSAGTDIVEGLLALPAPPPPNPLAEPSSKPRDDKFYEDKNVPNENAPIADLLEYWGKKADGVQELRYTPEASEKTLARIKKEIEKKPELLPRYLDLFPYGDDSSEFVKGMFDRESTSGAFDRDTREVIKRWMTYHTPYYSNDLFRIANGAGDTETYVENHRDLLALVRVDFEKARPIISRLESNSSGKPSRSLAAWANYRHALDTDSTGDIEQYRDELKAIVENKSYSGPSRDLAMDALVGEKEWPGRDEWYMSLLGDESLADLNGYTGLTTLMLVSPVDKYVDRMVALVGSNDPVVRAAAIRNLLTRIGAGNPEIIRVMLPWLEDPKWAVEHNNERESIVNALRDLKIPESVPGLISTLDERTVIQTSGMANAANAAVNSASYAANAAANAATSAMMSAANVATNSIPRGLNNPAPEYSYPLRYSAVFALAAQEDIRAVPPLRRLLNEMFGYERNNVVKAILKCKGFTALEQLDALETAVRAGDAEPDYSYSNTNSYYDDYDKPTPLTPKLLKKILGDQLLEATEVGDDLAAAVIARIAVLDQSDKLTADMMRKIVLRWQNPVVNAMLLQDVKRDRSSVDAAIRLLSQRAELRTKQPSDVYDLNTGSPTSIGFAACMIEDVGQYAAIVSGDNIKAKSALYACARLIRAPLDLSRAAADMRSSDKQLAVAAERYLISEDSAAARAAVLSKHPGEAFVTGARYAFFNEDTQPDNLTNENLFALFGSIEPDGDSKIPYDWSFSVDNVDHEKELRKEVLADNDMLGVYSYKNNVIRIYADRVNFQWDNDGSRYNERLLSHDEFEYLKSYLAANRVDELKPFLSCTSDTYCNGEELLMMGKNGGRRVFVSADPMPPFFQGLDKYFEELRLGKGTVKYALSKEVPGLEILLANDDLHALTVWKSGDDLRVAVSDQRTRKRVKLEIEKAIDESLSSSEGTENAPSRYEVEAQLTEKRKYDGYSWIKVVNGASVAPSTQPAGFEIIPLRDGQAVQPYIDQWKSRAPGFELRPDTSGLFKLSGGKMSKILKGNFENSLVTPNGRWALAFRYDEDYDASLVRINLLTNREYPIVFEDYRVYYPLAYIPTLNKVLIVEQTDNYGEEEDYVPDETLDEIVESDPTPDQMQLVDPATGTLQPASGEFRPLTQQSFRPLQKTAIPNEFWAAIPDSKNNKTAVGIYDIKTFGFKTILTVPKMTFSSMSMWVDEPTKSVYFVYRGHLLKLPLGK